jgi:signal transduction histidine kinase
MGGSGFTLYKQDTLMGITPVITSANSTGNQPPYISAASDLTAYLRNGDVGIFTMQANTFRDQLVRKGISTFGVDELLVCPITVMTPSDFVLTFGTKSSFKNSDKAIAQAAGEALTPLLLEFILAVCENTQPLNMASEFNTTAIFKAQVFKVLQDVLRLNSYAYLIHVIKNYLPQVGAVILEDKRGHAIASSENGMTAFKNRLTPLTYQVLLDIIYKSNDPLVVSNSVFISSGDSSGSKLVASAKNHLENPPRKEDLKDFQSLVIPLGGGEDFIGFLIIFNISQTDISNNIPFIAAISFAATYLIQNHEASKSQTLRHILSSVENERRSVSIDLHDETSQNLVALNVRLSTAQRALERNQTEDASHILEDCCCIADNILTEVNRLSSELRSSELTYLGLRSAIEAEANRRLAKVGIAYTLTGNALDRHFDAFQETMLLKGVIEALSNCARHAQATEVDISLDEDDEWFSIQISDNGIGFDDTEITSWDSPQNYGMKTMHDCADSLGGIFWIGSYPGDGTTVRFSVPSRLLEEVSYG